MSDSQQGPGRPRSAPRSQPLPITSHGQPEQLLGLARLLLRMHRGPALRVVAERRQKAAEREATSV